MRKKRNKNVGKTRAQSERGAALIVTLLIATLLLLAGGALILTTSFSATTAIESTNEIQAYYGAEAGLQDTLNVLRGNIASHKNATTPINLKNAADPSISNEAGDPFGVDDDGVPRLSAWLNYTYKNGSDWRVPVSANYSPINGIAYTIKITAPDEDAPPIDGKPSKDDGFKKPNPAPNPKPTMPAWHLWHCGHCSWDYSHHPFCKHHHCTAINAVWVPDNWEYNGLYIESTGYGPKGAIKRLQMTVAKTDVDMKAGAAITIIGADGNANPHFDLGSTAQDHQYKGADVSNKTDIAAFGFSTDDLAWVNGPGGEITTADPHCIDVARTTELTSSNTPKFLQSADAARRTTTNLAFAAQAYGGYFTTYNGVVGTPTVPDYVFVDGDATLTGGAGLLVVTGTLTMNLTSDFKGIVMVLGGGSMQMTATADNHFKGLIFIAKFDRTWDPSQNNQDHPFLAPSFDNSGNSKMLFQFDSLSAMNALDTLPHAVTGVVER